MKKMKINLWTKPRIFLLTKSITIHIFNSKDFTNIFTKNFLNDNLIFLIKETIYFFNLFLSKQCNRKWGFKHSEWKNAFAVVENKGR